MAETVSYRLDRPTYKKLQQLKLDMDKKSIGSVIEELIKVYENKK